MKETVVNYDEVDYDYRTYWQTRLYENSVEQHAVQTLLRDERGKYFLDIGGSYGRNIPLYYKHFEQCIIVDYSLKTLQKYYKNITKKYQNVTLIAANAYHLPFVSNVFDGVMMIRVLHHLDRPQDVFSEIARVQEDSGVFILEFANKLHLKARLKWFLTGKWQNFSLEPYQQPSVGNLEGAKEDSPQIFLNFHFKFIQNLLRKVGFVVEKKIGCSFFRLPVLKKVFPANALISADQFLQKIALFAELAPSIVIKARASKKDIISAKQPADFYRILACPICKGQLLFEGDSARCEHCQQAFYKKDNIWDFRYVA